MNTQTEISQENLRAAGCDALKLALDRDLPIMVELVVDLADAAGLSQSDQRDWYALRHALGIHYGAAHVHKRGPQIADVRTFVTPQSGGPVIIVQCKTGAAAIYRPVGSKAVRLAVVGQVTESFLCSESASANCAAGRGQHACCR